MPDVSSKNAPYRIGVELRLADDDALSADIDDALLTIMVIFQ